MCEKKLCTCEKNYVHVEKLCTCKKNYVHEFKQIINFNFNIKNSNIY